MGSTAQRSRLVVLLLCLCACLSPALATDIPNGPFLSVLPDTAEVRADPWGCLQTRLESPLPDDVLTTAATAGGIGYACRPSGAVVPPDADMVGEAQRNGGKGARLLLGALSEETRQRVRTGAMVNVTAQRETVVSALTVQTPRGPMTVPGLDTAPHIFLGMRPCPELEVYQPAEDGGAWAGVLFLRWAVPPSLLQVADDGTVAWSDQPPAEQHPFWVPAATGWRPPEAVGQGAVSALQRALAESGSMVSLEELSGLTVGEVVERASERVGEDLPISDVFGERLVLARGGEAPWSEVIAAVLASAWAAPRWDGERAAYVWVADADDPSDRLSRALAAEARRAFVPELCAQTDTLVGDCFEAHEKVLSELPLRPDLFRQRWTGRLSELLEADRQALEAMLEPMRWRHVPQGATRDEATGKPQQMVITRCADLGEDPIVRFHLNYKLWLGNSAEYAEPDPASRALVPKAVPDRIYDELGAVRGRAVYLCHWAAESLY